MYSVAIFICLAVVASQICEIPRKFKGHPFEKSKVIDTIRYDTIGEFNVDWKAEYSALSTTRSQKKKLKQPTPVPL